MAHFGETVRKLRESKRWSQDKLAAIGGISRATVQNAEAQKVPNLHGNTYHKIADALGLTSEQLDALWRDDAAPPAPPMIVPERRLREYARERGINPDVAVELVVAYLRFSAEQFDRGDDHEPHIVIEGPMPPANPKPPPAAAAPQRRRR
jgi:transcriptional regulator with XRE-family HTH domain